jgi:NADH-quinone oxidoreductase subunit L
MGQDYHGIGGFLLHAFKHPLVLILMSSGIFVAWLCYIKFPEFPEKLVSKIGFIHKILLNKYGFDDFNQLVFARGTREIGQVLWKIGDEKIIDGFFVNGAARSVQIISNIVRNVQTGYLYHYAFAIIVGLLVLLGVFVHGILN